MGISERERVLRRDSIGSSDVPAILGLCPFRTIHDVYLEKAANMNMAENDLRDNMAVLVGEKVEMSVVNYGYEVYQKTASEKSQLVYDYKIVRKDLGKAPKHANLDGFVLGDHNKVLCVIEAKTSSFHKNWGENGSDKIPPNVMAQVQWQMGLIEADQCLVSLLLTAFRAELRTYPIKFCEDTFKSICEAVDEFWLSNVETRTPPLPSLPSRENLSRIERKPSAAVEIPKEVFEQIAEKREKFRIAKEELEEAQRYAIASLEDAEEGVCELGTISYKETHRKAYQVAAKSMRVFRTKAAKKEKTDE